MRLERSYRHNSSGEDRTGLRSKEGCARILRRVSSASAFRRHFKGQKGANERVNLLPGHVRICVVPADASAAVAGVHLECRTEEWLTRCEVENLGCGGKEVLTNSFLNAYSF